MMGFTNDAAKQVCDEALKTEMSPFDPDIWSVSFFAEDLVMKSQAWAAGVWERTPEAETEFAEIAMSIVRKAIALKRSGKLDELAEMEDDRK